MQKNFLVYVNNCFNDTKREAFAEVRQKLDDAQLLNPDIERVLDEMIESVKTNKKIKKPSKPRFTAYTLYLKEERAQVKAQNTGISSQELTKVVAQSWASVSDERKAELDARAKEQKRLYELENDIKPEDETEKKKQKKIRKGKGKKAVNGDSDDAHSSTSADE